MKKERRRESYEQALPRKTSITSTHRTDFPEVAVDWKDQERASHPGRLAQIRHRQTFGVLGPPEPPYPLPLTGFIIVGSCYPLTWSLRDLISLSPFINTMPSRMSYCHDSLSARVRCQLRVLSGASQLHTRTENHCIAATDSLSPANVFRLIVPVNDPSGDLICLRLRTGKHPRRNDLSFSRKQGYDQACAWKRGQRCVSQFNQK